MTTLKKLLLTGFEPFLDYTMNPSGQIAAALSNQVIGEYQVISRVLPVNYQQAGVMLLSQYDAARADAVLMLGLAAGRTCVTPERVAVNWDGAVSDNAGHAPQGKLIDVRGGDAYLTQLPLAEIIAALRGIGLPAAVSNTAGTYLCNHVMYKMLNHLRGAHANIPAGFVHLPASHDLVICLNKEMPSWSFDDLLRAVRMIISCL
ncbi:MAG: pyroglutamyl-peptidase I [Sporolactobacillus sp.]